MLLVSKTKHLSTSKNRTVKIAVKVEQEKKKEREEVPQIEERRVFQNENFGNFVVEIKIQPKKVELNDVVQVNHILIEIAVIVNINVKQVVQDSKSIVDKILVNLITNIVIVVEDRIIVVNNVITLEKEPKVKVLEKLETLKVEA